MTVLKFVDERFPWLRGTRDSGREKFNNAFIARIEIGYAWTNAAFWLSVHMSGERYLLFTLAEGQALPFAGEESLEADDGSVKACAHQMPTF
jgi:hypothetical protein